MPELPEVDFARDCLQRWVVGRELRSVVTETGRVTRGTDLAHVRELTSGRFTSVERKGKWLALVSTSPWSLLVHLGMTGKFELHLPGEVLAPWSRARFVRADGAVISFRDPRQFGRILLRESERLFSEPPWSELGPDAWSPGVSAALLGQRLAGHKRTIKDVLMDQGVLSGLGNIQVTDALFLAGIRPRRRTDGLTRDEVVRLARAIRRSLRRTLAMNSGDKIVYVEETQRRVNPFWIYGKAATPCPRCRTGLRKVVIAGRTSAYCPTCQK